MHSADTGSVVVADELSLIREGIAALCEKAPGCHVVGQASDGEEAYRLIDALRPDFAVLDLNLPKLFSIEIARRVSQQGLATKVVIISSRGDRKTVLDALRSGVSAFVLKAGPARHLVDAFEQVRNGGVYVSPLLRVTELFAGSSSAGSEEDLIETLSAREYQVFSLLVEGLRAKEIAARLDLSPKTVDTYRASLMRKLDIHDLAGLVKFAIQRSLIPVTAPARLGAAS